MRRFLIYQKEDFNNTLKLSETIPLSNGYFLDFDANLSVIIIGQDIIVLGVVTLAKDSRDKLLHLDPSDSKILDLIYGIVCDWSGRWILIFNNLIIGDPLNSLNLFYSNRNNGFLLANSLGIFRSLKYNRNNQVYNPTSRDEINWNISPQTRLEQVYLLLPFQIFDLNHGINTFQRFLKTRINRDINTQEINQNVVGLFKRYIEFDKQIFLTLTAGYDSRYLFAGLLSSLVEFKNLIFIDKRIKKADIKISKELSQNFDIRQERKKICSLNFGLKRFSISFRNERIDDFDCFNCQEIDREWYIKGLYNSKKESILLRGNIGTEVFQGYKNFLYYPKGDGSIKSVIDALRKKYPNLNNEQSIDIAYWWESRSEFIKETNIDWRLLFWLDQRCCSWAGAINSVFDLTNYHAINPLNSDTLLEQLYIFTNKGDIENGYQRHLIQDLNSELNNFPYNPKYKKVNFSKKNIINKILLILWQKQKSNT